MAEQLTPPTGAIRRAWIDAHPFRASTPNEEREAEFDRWLAAHDVELRAEVERLLAFVGWVAALDNPDPNSAGFQRRRTVTLTEITNRASAALAGSGEQPGERWAHIGRGWIEPHPARPDPSREIRQPGTGNRTAPCLTCGTGEVVVLPDSAPADWPRPFEDHPAPVAPESTDKAALDVLAAMRRSDDKARAHGGDSHRASRDCPECRARFEPVPDSADVRVAVAQIIAESACDWDDVERDGHHHTLACTNWRAWLGEADRVLAAVGQGVTAEQREQAVASLYRMFEAAKAVKGARRAGKTALSRDLQAILAVVRPSGKEGS